MKTAEKLRDIANLLKNQDYKKAQRASGEVLRKEPNNIYALNFFGLSLQGVDEIKESIIYFNRAVQANKNFISALNNLASSHKALGEIDSAKKIYEKIISMKKDYIPALNNLAFIEYEYSNHEKAFRLFNNILDLDKKDERSLFYLGTIRSEEGNFTEASSYFKKVLKINPKNISAHNALALITTYNENNQDSLQHIVDMKELIKEELPEAIMKSSIHFCLGKAFDDTRDYKKAFSHYSEANHVKTQTLKNYDFELDKNLFEDLKLFFLEFDFKNIKVKEFDKKLIFVCGLPRSGTTLTEQILASHNKVTTAGELNYLSGAIEKYIKPSFNLDTKLIDKLILNNDIQNYYQKRLNNHIVGPNHIIDKAPLNYRWIGFIKLFFPNAKVIHVSRNAEDNCLSLFKNKFISRDLRWTYSQKNIAGYYNLYFDLMKFWEKKLPNFIYDLKYENIINDKENEITKLLKFCNLEWDENCLTHHQRKNLPIKTASLSQARKPVYSCSIGSNKHYSNSLKEMFSLIKKKNIH